MIFARRLLDLPFLVILLGLASICMAVPAAYAVVLGNFPVARAFFYSGSVLFVVTTMVALATATRSFADAPRNQIASVVATYLLLPFVLAIPVHQAMPGLPFQNAWFEMLSCFSATGATLFDAPDLVDNPIHLWRAMVGWLGGFYGLLIAAAILAPMALGGIDLLAGRMPGKIGGGLQITKVAEPSQRLRHYFAVLFPVYGLLTLMLWVGLLIAGDTALIALSHAMGTISTSGVSAISGLGSSASGIAGEAIIAVFLCLAITRRLWPGSFWAEGRLKIMQDPELRLAFGLVAVVTVVLVVRHAALAAETASMQSAIGTLRAIWGAAFTALSFLTTTGYHSTSWPDLGSPGLVLLGLAMIGGGVATTAGGVKLLRVTALLRHGERELERIIHPHSIGGHGPVARRLRREGAYFAWIFFMIFGLSISGLVAALTLTGIEFHDALILAIACLTNTGQLATTVAVNPISYSTIGGAAQAILGIAMIMGRVEILAVLVLLSPKGWSR